MKKKGLSKKFNLRWLSLSKPPYLVQWSFRQAQEPPVEGLNDRYSHYFLDSPFFCACSFLRVRGKFILKQEGLKISQGFLVRNSDFITRLWTTD